MFPQHSEETNTFPDSNRSFDLKLTQVMIADNAIRIITYKTIISQVYMIHIGTSFCGAHALHSSLCYANLMVRMRHAHHCVAGADWSVHHHQCTTIVTPSLAVAVEDLHVAGPHHVVLSFTPSIPHCPCRHTITTQRHVS